MFKCTKYIDLIKQVYGNLKRLLLRWKQEYSWQHQRMMCKELSVKRQVSKRALKRLSEIAEKASCWIWHKPENNGTLTREDCYKFPMTLYNAVTIVKAI